MLDSLPLLVGEPPSTWRPDSQRAPPRCGVRRLEHSPTLTTDTAIKVSSRNVLDLVAGDKIICSDVSVDKTTGAISAAPWIGEVGGGVEDILVTCSGFRDLHRMDMGV